MRLREVERGETLGKRLLIGLISLVSRMRLPDAARVAFYHASFGRPLGAWTQAAMRGASAWTVGERELMAAMVAKWNACTFCVGAHRAVAVRELPVEMVDAALADPANAPVSRALRATLTFLQKMTLDPDGLTPDDARSVLQSGVSREALEDAIAVATLFAIITRYADALDFAIPSADELDRAAAMLLRRGYGPG